jgi:hypothetical protein
MSRTNTGTGEPSGLPTTDKFAFSVQETARRAGVSTFLVRKAIKDDDLFVK